MIRPSLISGWEPTGPGYRPTDMRWRKGLCALLAVVAVSCEGTPAEPQGSAPATHGDDLLYECSRGFAFNPFRFTPGNAEEGTDAKAEALRRVLGSAEGAGLLPRSGWAMVGRRGNEVGFVARDAGGHFYDARIEKERGRWRWAGFGECKPGPQLAVGDASIVEWVLDPDAPAPEEGDRVIHALVSELACHSFEDPLDRMNEPRALYHEDGTYVVLTAEPLEGLQMCPGTPWVEFDIRLDEPLPDANLFDASLYPPRTATREPN